MFLQDNEELFQLSFNQILFDSVKRTQFFEKFYTNFIDQAPDVKAYFSKSDMQQQSKILRQSFLYVIEFSTTNKPTTRLKELAELHSRKQLNIPPELYEHWLNAMLKTVGEINPDTDGGTIEAWREVLLPGIEYMKKHY